MLARMKPRLSLVTLGVADLPRALRFYRDGLGWPTASVESDGVAFFKLGGVVLSLYPRDKLAEDAAVAPAGRSMKYPAIQWPSGRILRPETPLRLADTSRRLH